MKKPADPITLRYNNRDFKLLVTPDCLIGMEEAQSSFDESAKTDFIINRNTICNVRFQSSNPNQMGHNPESEILWIETKTERWEFSSVYPSAKVVAFFVFTNPETFRL